MKKTVTILLLILLLIFTALLAVPISNDCAAMKTAQRIADIPLPTHTEYIESAYLAGKLTGNGNGMQYLGAILIKSDLSMEELSAYYRNFNDNNCKYNVKNQTDKKIRESEHTELSFKTDIQGSNYYIVYAWGNNNAFARGFDLRGH